MADKMSECPRPSDFKDSISTPPSIPSHTQFMDMYMYDMYMFYPHYLRNVGRRVKGPGRCQVGQQWLHQWPGTSSPGRLCGGRRGRGESADDAQEP